jgi:hypothetical protein
VLQCLHKKFTIKTVLSWFFSQLYSNPFYTKQKIITNKELKSLQLQKSTKRFQLIYLPCVYALSKKQIRDMGFCYELMLEMCLFDMCTMIFTSFVTAYSAILGQVFCSSPTFQHFSSNIMYGKLNRSFPCLLYLVKVRSVSHFS